MPAGGFMKNGYSDKTTARIITVDPRKRRVEGALTDGGMVQIYTWAEVATVFRWPKPGEVWTIRKDGGYWRLDARIQNDHDALGRIEDLAIGSTRITGDTIYLGGDAYVEGKLLVRGHEGVRKWVGVVGDGTNTVYKLRHNLGTLDVHVGIRETAATNGEYDLIFTDVVRLVDENHIKLTFATAPAARAYTVTVIG